jgi:hypothetical protein
MSKPSLQLVHRSNGIPPGAKRRRNDGGFRPFVIDGGVSSAPADRSWQAAFELAGLGFFAFYGSYFALLEASITVLGVSNWTNPETTS